ncbi:MAG: hypothetical protein Q9O62_14810 [Ardenticatenia bacterium]|nr:hypothetical protein [Ardenticatenia bacterium]
MFVILCRRLEIVFAIVLVLLSSTVALAVTINVDGNRELAWDTSTNGQTPGQITDVDESLITNDVDIEEFKWTNDTTYLYFLVDTYDIPRIAGGLSPTRIYVCIDVDNDVNSGGYYGNCNSQSGFDKLVVLNGTTSVELYTYNSGTGSFEPVSSPGSSFGYDTGAAVPVIEIQVPLNDLGITSSATCIQTMPSVVYYDNGTVDPDDNVPDSGNFNLGCGLPTAITLESFDGGISSTYNSTFLLLTGAFGGLLAVGGWALWRRHR